MEIETIQISKIKLNPNNPRLIKDDKFNKLVQSIKDFPEMLNIRPIVVNEDMIILGGNMRFKACKEAGLKEVPIIKASGLSAEKQREFLIKDNVSGGEWDWTLLQEWDSIELGDWGLDLPSFAADVDYSILDEEDVSDQLKEMTDGVKKAIQIEFEAEHYEEAQELIKFFRDKKVYIGALLVEKLKYEKDLL